MGASKITPEQREALRGLYKAGKGAQAQKLARELGVSAYYATILVQRAGQPRPSVRKSRPTDVVKWAKATAKGPILA